MQQIRDWYNIVKNLMGKLVGSKNRMVILKTVLLLGFFTALIGTVIFVEGMETPAEDAIGFELQIGHAFHRLCHLSFE